MIRALLAAAIAGGAALGIVHAESARRPLFYQDPDGKPFYAAAPAKTADGRAYRPVFEDAGSAHGTSHPAPVPASHAASAPAPMRQPDHRILYYRNPMGLADTSPTPKKDGMGMDYIPVHADEDVQGDPPGTVRITPGRMQTLGVRTEAAEMRVAPARNIRATGILQFDERHLATVTTKVSGWIEHLDVTATGDPVRRGQVLAEIYSPSLVASEEEYLIASRIGSAFATASADRLRALDVPASEIARLRRTSRAAHRIDVVAAEPGVVVEKPVQEGMRVEAGEALYKTADLSSLWLIAQVQERDLGAVRPGQRAGVSFVAFPGRTFEGRVDFIYPELSAGTRTARVRIVLPNPDGALRASMYADVRIDAGAGGPPVLSVPSSAVLDTGMRQVVLVEQGGGRFAPRQVHLGVQGDDRVQVLDGIGPGDRVVVGANFLIDAESNLRAALQGFSDGGAQAAQPGAAQ